MVATEKGDAEVFTTTCSSKGQVVIPKALRDRLGIRAGDVVDVKEDDGKLVLSVRRETKAELKARLFGPPLAIEEIAGMFADRVRPELRGLSMAEVRKIAQVDFARRWREKEARIAAQVGTDEGDDE